MSMSYNLRDWYIKFVDVGIEYGPSVAVAPKLRLPSDPYKYYTGFINEQE